MYVCESACASTSSCVRDRKRDKERKRKRQRERAREQERESETARQQERRERERERERDKERKTERDRATERDRIALHLFLFQVLTWVIVVLSREALHGRRQEAGGFLHLTKNKQDTTGRLWELVVFFVFVGERGGGTSFLKIKMTF